MRRADAAVEARASSGSRPARTRSASPASPARASPCPGRSRGGPRAGPRARSRSRVVNQSRSTPKPGSASAAAVDPAVVGEVLATSRRTGRPAPRPAGSPRRPGGRRGRAGPRSATARRRGSGSRSPGPSERSALIACLSSRSRWSMVSGRRHRRPLERGVRLGHEPADRHRAPDVLGAGRAARPALITSWASRAICSTSSSVSVGRPHMKYSFTCRQPLRVRGDDGADQVLLGHHLVDHLADPLRAALGGERQAGAAAVAGQLLGQGRC